MTCHDFQSRVSAYIEGDQNEVVRSLMESHLSVCPGCAESLHGVRGIQAELARLPRPRLSSDFNFALRGRLLMEAGRSRGFRDRVAGWLFPPRMALAGALTLVLLAGLALTAGNLYRSPAKAVSQRMDAASPTAGDLPSHYVLERIPATPHRGVSISSQTYKTRGDSLYAPGRTANVQYVRF